MTQEEMRTGAHAGDQAAPHHQGSTGKTNRGTRSRGQNKLKKKSTELKMKKLALAMTAAALAAILTLAAACGGDSGESLSQAEVEQIVNSAIEKAAANSDAGEQPGEDSMTAGISGEDAEARIQAAIAAMPTAGAGMTAGISGEDVEARIQAAIAAMPTAEAGMSQEKAEEMARETARNVVAAMPAKSDPAAYTRFVVENAVRRYQTEGLDPTLAHYNRAESIDGQWYVFIIDENDLVTAHPDPQLLGLDAKGWVGTDANGYRFGPEMLSATGEGKWVSYVYQNPESGDIGAGHFTGELELKNVWVVRHDGLLFASGWYIDADEFTKSLVATAARVFREVGLEGTIAYFASPEIVFGGLAAVIAYYNSAEKVEGDWFAFVADESGTVIDHYRKDMVGKSLEDVFGTDAFEVTTEGNWVTTEDLRVWVLSQDGMTFGSGWHHDETGGAGASTRGR